MAKVKSHAAWAEVTSDDDCAVLMVYTTLDEFVGAIHTVEDQDENILYKSASRADAINRARDLVDRSAS